MVTVVTKQAEEKQTSSFALPSPLNTKLTLSRRELFDSSTYFKMIVKLCYSSDSEERSGKRRQ